MAVPSRARKKLKCTSHVQLQNFRLAEVSVPCAVRKSDAMFSYNTVSAVSASTTTALISCHISSDKERRVKR